jgi:hypothetical protein
MATTFNEFGEVVEVVTAEEIIEQQNREFLESGGADDDSGLNPDTEENPVPTDDELAEWAKTPEYKFMKDTGATPQGKSGTPAAKTATPKPGKRTQNPLGEFSSYTYQLSLYMITPDAYDAFVASGRRDINAITSTGQSVGGNGAYLIAQSGGINNSGNTKRAPNFDVDFFIDDLKIGQAIGTQDTGTASNVTEISFNIYEPYGFSFITRLRNAMDKLASIDTKTKNYKDMKNPSRQFFILGIRFQGYDKNGNLISANNQVGQNADPSKVSQGMFERYYDIMIRGMKFKLDGKTTVYNITAACVPNGAAYGTKRGIVDNGSPIRATTVYEALMGSGNGKIGLLKRLNDEQQQLLDDQKISIKNEYDVVFLGEAEKTIKEAYIVSEADLNKLKWPMTKAENVDQSNASTAENSKPDPTGRQITVPSGTPILQVIDQIISQSSYLEDALKVVYTANKEPNPEDKDEDQLDTKSKQTIKWYNLAADVKCLGWDPKQSDFCYKITYVIQPYETPVITSYAANTGVRYYGPHKRYEYWFTGKNSEILRYEQQMDNTFFTVAVTPDGDPKSQGGSADIPTVSNKLQNQPKQGKENVGLQAQNSYLTSLYDPGSFANAKLTIIGDPDFLMPNTTSSENTVYNQFYGNDGFTVNPNGGQVFIEINFKEPDDYRNKTGLLSINESILFWKYPAEVQKDLDSRGGGISYMVRNVVSTFRGGKFEQELTCNINTFGDAGQGTSDAKDAGRSGSGTSAPNANGNGTTSATGLKPASDYPDEFGDLAGAIKKQEEMNAQSTDSSTNVYQNQNTNITAPDKTGKKVQDDDATANNTVVNPVDEGGRE